MDLIFPFIVSILCLWCIPHQFFELLCYHFLFPFLVQFFQFEFRVDLYVVILLIQISFVIAILYNYHFRVYSNFGIRRPYTWLTFSSCCHFCSSSFLVFTVVVSVGCLCCFSSVVLFVCCMWSQVSPVLFLCGWPHELFHDFDQCLEEVAPLVFVFVFLFCLCSRFNVFVVIASLALALALALAWAKGKI